jgi:hypothetical protein
MSSSQNKNNYVRKRENRFEDVTRHKISRPGFIKTPEENMQKYLSEVAAAEKALYNHYNLEYNKLLNGHKLAICLAKEFIPGFLAEDYALGRPQEIDEFDQLALCMCVRIIQLEHDGEKISIENALTEVKKRWKYSSSVASLRARYYEYLKSKICTILLDRIKDHKQVMLEILEDIFNR